MSPNLSWNSQGSLALRLRAAYDAAMVVAGIVSKLNSNKPAILQSLKYLGKGSFWGRGQSVLKIIRLNPLVDVISMM